MEVKDKEKFNIPLKGWKILSAISSMVFPTVHCQYFFYAIKNRIGRTPQPYLFLQYAQLIRFGLLVCYNNTFHPFEKFFLPLVLWIISCSPYVILKGFQGAFGIQFIGSEKTKRNNLW
jgi:hypothetical protein